MQSDTIRLSWRYIWQSIAMAVGLLVVGLVAYVLCGLSSILVPLIVGACFSVVVDTAVGVVWRRIAERSPESLTTFYTAVSGFRLLLALATMMIYYLVVGSDAMRTFFFVFMAFYVLQLVHHSVFFAKVSGRS